MVDLSKLSFDVPKSMDEVFLVATRNASIIYST